MNKEFNKTLRSFLLNFKKEIEKTGNLPPDTNAEITIALRYLDALLSSGDDSRLPMNMFSVDVEYGTTREETLERLTGAIKSPENVGEDDRLVIFGVDVLSLIRLSRNNAILLKNIDTHLSYLIGVSKPKMKVDHLSPSPELHRGKTAGGIVEDFSNKIPSRYFDIAKEMIGVDTMGWMAGLVTNDFDLEYSIDFIRHLLERCAEMYDAADSEIGAYVRRSLDCLDGVHKGERDGLEVCVFKPSNIDAISDIVIQTSPTPQCRVMSLCIDVLNHLKESGDEYVIERFNEIEDIIGTRLETAELMDFKRILDMITEQDNKALVEHLHKKINGLDFVKIE